MGDGSPVLVPALRAPACPSALARDIGIARANKASRRAVAYDSLHGSMRQLGPHLSNVRERNRLQKDLEEQMGPSKHPRRNLALALATVMVSEMVREIGSDILLADTQKRIALKDQLIVAFRRNREAWEPPVRALILHGHLPGFRDGLLLADRLLKSCMDGETPVLSEEVRAVIKENNLSFHDSLPLTFESVDAARKHLEPLPHLILRKALAKLEGEALHGEPTAAASGGNTRMQDVH